MALVLAQELVTQGLDRQLPSAQRAFAYMPYMHSESRVVQAQSARLFAQPGLEVNLPLRCSTRPSSSALAATRIATPSWGEHPATKS
jgi:uncharacterized protein (DUF924 family)